MVEGKHYIAVTDSVAVPFIKAYQGNFPHYGPVIRHAIMASDEEDSEYCYEAYLKKITISVFPNEELYRFKTPKILHISRT